jgi:hypothetical protein
MQSTPDYVRKAGPMLHGPIGCFGLVISISSISNFIFLTSIFYQFIIYKFICSFVYLLGCNNFSKLHEECVLITHELLFAISKEAES